jgi:hypothetical protein
MASYQLGGSCTDDKLNQQHTVKCGADVESIKHTVLDCTVAKFFGEEVKLLTGVKVPLLHPITWASTPCYIAEECSCDFVRFGGRCG